MARPKKQRQICRKPVAELFTPEIRKSSENEVTLSLEEYEVIRLMDYENLDQKLTAEKIGVARSTVQRVYKDARTKIAKALVKGGNIRIQGGQYNICDKDKKTEDCIDCIEEIKKMKD